MAQKEQKPFYRECVRTHVACGESQLILDPAFSVNWTLGSWTVGQWRTLMLRVSSFLRSTSKIKPLPNMWRPTSHSRTCEHLFSKRKRTWSFSWPRSESCSSWLAVWLDPLSSTSAKLWNFLPFNSFKGGFSLFFDRSPSQVRDKMNLKVNSICAPARSCSKLEASLNIQHLRWEVEM